MKETDPEASSAAPSDSALAQLVAALRDRLSQALSRAAQAQVMVSAAQIDAAIGSLAGIESELADAAALHRSIILLRQNGASPSRRQEPVSN